MPEPALQPFTPDDYRFAVELLEGGLRLAPARPLATRLDAWLADPTPERRAALDTAIVADVGYLGSADLAYALRRLAGRDGGVPLDEVVRDVARHLEIRLPHRGTPGVLAAQLAEEHAARAFSAMTPEERQALLESAGVAADEAAAFARRSAGVFALPVLYEAFRWVVVEKLIRGLVLRTIVGLVGRRVGRGLLALLAARLPWWVAWIGPAAWTASIGWTALDLQGPARRKTVPFVLYLGLCHLRERPAPEVRP